MSAANDYLAVADNGSASASYFALAATVPEPALIGVGSAMAMLLVRRSRSLGK